MMATRRRQGSEDPSCTSRRRSQCGAYTGRIEATRAGSQRREPRGCVNEDPATGHRRSTQPTWPPRAPSGQVRDLLGQPIRQRTRRLTNTPWGEHTEPEIARRRVDRLRVQLARLAVAADGDARRLRPAETFCDDDVWMIADTRSASIRRGCVVKPAGRRPTRHRRQTRRSGAASRRRRLRSAGRRDRGGRHFRGTRGWRLGAGSVTVLRSYEAQNSHGSIASSAGCSMSGAMFSVRERIDADPDL
jgi:hypothetical protein